ncbi:ribonuclease H family protein [Pediococcus argentinicus]|uniref:Ribonuclease H n=1 Tax=Pediococcus argentinicus TaxID=480391 RepID=A0A0R2NHS4_9LACO|nr:ribonuclease H family protein [Pediococcus argentinicus]KRO25334.1 hypothetical protein IV88_GL000279 [Pediococcus argentinicus]NKZ22073.1 reverse transcriptase-like protein [Pediococcus argentinicus]GEP19411.1 ribonuclease H [Pediococcus argentinicus]
MAKKKFYAVRKGKQTGLFNTWDETKAQVDGFSGAQYKSFGTKAEAENWLTETTASSTPKSTPTSTNESLVQTVLYTDGGSRNTGNVRGGHVRGTDLAAWAFLLQGHNQKISGSDGEKGATNNRMEIMALLEGLKAIRDHFSVDEPVLVVSDSKYVLDAINQHWLRGWKRNQWRKKNGEVVANKELWIEVEQLLGQFKHLELKWTKGHASNEGNVFVDELLNETMDKMAANQDSHTETVKQSQPQVHSETKQPEKKTPAPTETSKSVEDLKETFKQMGLFDN